MVEVITGTEGPLEALFIQLADAVRHEKVELLGHEAAAQITLLKLKEIVGKAVSAQRELRRHPIPAGGQDFKPRWPEAWRFDI